MRIFEVHPGGDLQLVGGRAERTQLQRWVEHLAIPRHAVEEAAANRRTGCWIAETFASFGYDVRWQGRFRNVVALPPARVAQPLTVIGAHYDSVPGSPGADDNASGVAVMLACARRLAGRFPVAFVAFNQEEDGMLGSIDFVRHGIDELGIQLSGVHVLEMVGCCLGHAGSQRHPPLPVNTPDRGDFIGVVANRDSRDLLKHALSAAAEGGLLHLIALKMDLGLERLFPDLWRSDHAAFWKQRVPALLWTDTADYRNRHYHLASDSPETLDYDFMAPLAELLVSLCLSDERRA